MLFRMTLVPGDCLFDRFSRGRGFHPKRSLELARINNKGLIKFIHHLNCFFCLRDEKSADHYHQFPHAAYFWLNTCFFSKDPNQFCLCDHGLVVWHMPCLTISFSALTQNDQCGAKIFYISMRVWQICPPDKLSSFAIQQWIKCTRAHRGVCAPRTEEITSTRRSNPHTPVLMCSKCRCGYLCTRASFARVSVIWRILSHVCSMHFTIHIQVFGKYQLGGASR